MPSVSHGSESRIGYKYCRDNLGDVSKEPGSDSFVIGKELKKWISPYVYLFDEFSLVEKWSAKTTGSESTDKQQDAWSYGHLLVCHPKTTAIASHVQLSTKG